MSLIGNERTKLTATAVNNLALAFAVGGFVGPIIALSFGLGSAPNANSLTIGICAAWLSAAVVLHIIARQMLGRLTP